MHASNKRIQWLAGVLAVAAWAAVERSASAHSDFSARDLKAARVVWATIENKLMEGDPGPALVRQVRSLGEGQDFYCYESPKLEERVADKTASYQWICRIDFGSEYKALKELPLPDQAERKKQGFVRTDDETGAQVFYQERRGISRVRFKKVHQGVYLGLSVIREINESPDEAVAKSQKRWKFFYEAARFHGISNQDTLVVKPNDGDLAGQELEDGDVILLDLDSQEFKKGITLELEIHVESPDMRDDEKTEIHVDIPEKYRRYVLTNATRPARLEHQPPNRDQIESSSRDLTFGLFFSMDAKEQLKDDAMPITIRFRGTKKQIFLLLADWYPVITRFEILQCDSHVRVPRPTGVLAKDVLNFGQYNEARDGLGALLDTWQRQLEPFARTRAQGPQPGAEQAFKPEEPVLAGWGLNPETKVSFLTAEERPEDSEKEGPGIFTAGAHLVAQFDVWIVHTVKPETKPKQPDTKAVENNEGWGTIVLDEETRIDLENEQRELWRKYRVEEFQLSVHEVYVPTEADTDSPRDWNVRGTACEGHALGAPLFGRVKEDRLDKYTRLDATDDGSPDHRFQLRKPGVYEVRLQMTLQHFQYRKPKSVDVAIRIRVGRKEITEIRRIEYNAERASFRDPERLEKNEN